MSSLATPHGRSSVSHAATYLVYALFAVILASHWPDVVALLRVWSTNHGLSHGYLALPVLLWLIWDVRGQLTLESRTPLVFACAALLALGVVWAMAYVASVESLRELLLPVCAALVVLGVFGLHTSRALAFPLAWLYTCLPLPLWTVLPGPLQAITAAVSGAVVGLFGIPIYMHGSMLTVPVGTFEVAGDCSGTNFFIVAVAISTLYGYLLRLPAWSRAALLGIAVLLAMIANWLRVIVIVMAAVFTNMQSSLVRDHYQFGWGLFAGTIVIFLFVARRWFAPLGATEPRKSALGEAADFRFPGGRLAAVLVAALAGPAWGYAALHAQAGALPAETAWHWPLVEGWHSTAVPSGAWRPTMPGATQESRVAYGGPAGLVVAHMSAYTVQRAGAKLIGYDSVLAGGPGWNEIVGATVMMQSGPAQEIVALGPDGERWRVRYWYEVGGRRTATTFEAKRWQALTLWHGPAISRLVAAATPCTGACDDAPSAERLERVAAAVANER